jgi:carboxymethylenebutenolidase
VARSILCVVVHDAIGYRPDNESRSARITAAGFVAITPNLFARWQGALHRQGFRELLTQRGRALEDIFAARDHVQSMPECTGSVGVVGFRMGLTRIGDGAQGFWRFGTVLLPAAATPPQ